MECSVSPQPMVVDDQKRRRDDNLDFRCSRRDFNTARPASRRFTTRPSQRASQQIADLIGHQFL
jgi:hypothetical protein